MLINKRRESSNVNYGCRTLVVGQGRLEEEREPIPDISKDASLGSGAAGGPGLGPAAGESELLELVGRSSGVLGPGRWGGGPLGLVGQDLVGIGDALVAGLDGVLDVLVVLGLDQLDQLVRVLADNHGPGTKEVSFL